MIMPLPLPTSTHQVASLRGTLADVRATLAAVSYDAATNTLNLGTASLVTRQVGAR